MVAYKYSEGKCVCVANSPMFCVHALAGAKRKQAYAGTLVAKHVLPCLGQASLLRAARVGVWHEVRERRGMRSSLFVHNRRRYSP